MNPASLVQQRLHNQSLTGPARRTPAGVVAWLGAVQAQEYPPARWGLALRMPEGTTDAAIERAFDAGRILRTHVLRPTWHFVTPRDIRWMLELTAPHVRRAMAPYDRRLELDARTLNRASAIFERALRDERHLTRLELGAHLARDGIAATGQRLAHIALHAELEAVICSGPRRGKRFTYALLAERAPEACRLGRDEALAELTYRYFRSHGPATVRDFVWWSGLKTADARRGLEIIRARHLVIAGLTYWSVDGAASRPARRRAVHLLPVYDEYIVAYRDRQAVPHVWPGMERGRGRSVSFQHPIVVNGQVAGTWRLGRVANGVNVDVSLARALTPAFRRELAVAAARYGRFVGTRVAVAIASGQDSAS